MLTACFIQPALFSSRLIAYGLPGEELVTNGGFESGDFKGWSADATCKVRHHSVTGQYYEPAHSGKYSARIGTHQVKGSLSQTVSIPRKSSSRLSFWYRVEKGSSLDVYLRKADGSLIQQWSGVSNSPWTSVTYELGTTYAGQDVAIEFVGGGYMEEIGQLMYDPNTGTWVYVIVGYNYYWPYVDDVSLTFEIVAYEVNIKIAGLSSSLSTRISIDGSEKETARGGEIKTILFNIGETHEISVEDCVNESPEIKYLCKHNSETISSDGSIEFVYTVQYLLTVRSAYGNPEGSGWYDAGSSARFSVTSPVSAGVGVQYVFERWSGDYSGTEPTATTAMDSPKTVEAVWRTDYSQLYFMIGGIVVIILAVVVTIVFLLRRRKPPAVSLEKKKEMPPPPRPKEETPEEYRRYLARLEDLRMQDKISQETYEELKEEYEKKLRKS